MQGHLGGFADRAHEDEHAGNCQIQGQGAELRDGGDDVTENNRAGREPQKENTEHETEITDAVDDECLLPGICCRVLRVVMADEDVGTDAHQFPKDKHHHEIIRQHDAEH